MLFCIVRVINKNESFVDILKILSTETNIEFKILDTNKNSLKMTSHNSSSNYRVSSSENSKSRIDSVIQNLFKLFF